MYEAFAAASFQLAQGASTPEPLAGTARALKDAIAKFQRDFLDVSLKLIELSSDWRCSQCKRDVVRSISLVQRSPLKAVLKCRNCSARSPLTPQGEQRLRELYGESVAEAWDEGLRGFVREG